MSDHYQRYMATLGGILAQLPADELEGIEDDVRRAWREGRRLFLMGNGGSASTASHLVCDLAKGTSAPDRPRLKAIALTDNVATMTAYGNDVGYEVIFAEQLANLVEPGDVVVAISASGNSPNVLRAVELANEADALTIGLTGFRGGKLKPLVKRCVVVPSDNMQMIEDAHLVIGHALFSALRDEPFGN